MSEIELKTGERIEDLQYKGLRIIQNESGFRFGTDSVLLAGFVQAGKGQRIADLGAGTGVLSVLIEGRTGAKMTAIELQPEQCSMARRSFRMNGQDIELIEADMRTAYVQLGRGVFDAAVCNPPYYPANGGTVSQKGGDGYAGAATHDLFCTVEEVAKAASSLIKFGGKLFICCPTARLAEMTCALSAEKLEPKRMRLVASVRGKAPYLALIEAKKGAKPGIIWEPQLDVCGEDGAYTFETDCIYHRNRS